MKLIAKNPVTNVDLPEGLVSDDRPRIILSDDEIAQYLAAPDCDLEMKMMSLFARIVGGMRTAEVVRWDWSMIDREAFASCTVLRAKRKRGKRTGKIVHLDVPEIGREYLRLWWSQAGCPAAGPVFPVRRGERAGMQKKIGGVSFARRLRRELFKAGVFRVPPIQVPATSPGTRTDRGKRAAGTKPAPNPADPLYFDTPTSRCVDFHSFRRGYITGLARAGVNIQQAMNLASHSDPKTQMRYVSATLSRQPVPEAALPALPASTLGLLLANSLPQRSAVSTADLHGEAEFSGVLSRRERDRTDNIRHVKPALYH